MPRHFLAFSLLMTLASSVWAGTVLYYRPLLTGNARYKFEAVRLLSPIQNSDALSRITPEPSSQDLIKVACGLDSFVYDGLRLVNKMGVLKNDGAIDDLAVRRVEIAYNVSHQEAFAWLLASRVMFMDGTRDVAELRRLEEDMIATAEDVLSRLETFLPEQQALSLMPRLAWAKGYALSDFNQLPTVPVKTEIPVILEPLPETRVNQSRHGWYYIDRHVTD